MPFLGIPNEYVIAGCFLFGIWFAGILIRIIYWLSDKPGDYTFHVYLPVVGMRFYQFTSCLMLITAIILSGRISEPITFNEDFFSLTALSKSWWCVIRILLCALCTLLANCYHNHPAFRIFSCICLPGLAIVDLCSEISFVTEITCIQRGICIETKSSLSSLYLLAWRDLISAGFILTNTILAYWLCGLTGITDNTIYVPSDEHRALTAKLEKILAGNARKQKKKKENAEEGGLAKMMGF